MLNSLVLYCQMQNMHADSIVKKAAKRVLYVVSAEESRYKTN